MGGAEGGVPVMNGTGGAHAAEDYQQWMESKVAQGKASPQFPRHGGDVYSNTLPVRKVAPAKSKATLSKDALAVPAQCTRTLAGALLSSQCAAARWWRRECPTQL